MVKSSWFRGAFILLVLSGILGCAAQPLSPPPAFNPQPFETGAWTPKAENLVFVLDASSSMEDGYNGVEKFALARSVIANFNQTMPDLDIQTAVRSFGHHPAVSPRDSLALYGPADYSRSAVAESLGKVAMPGGPSPLDSALAAIGSDLKAAKGKVVVIVVSDGKDMGANVVAAAAGLKAQFSNQICIYTVQVGNDPIGAAVLAKVAGATGCGSTVTAEDVATGAGMAAFVKETLLAELADSDGDGVPDVRDRCPGTPRGAAVDSQGCPKDSDGDGVYDYQDACPDTPRGANVDKRGCPLPKAAATATVTAAGTWIFKGVQFESNSAALKSSSYPVLDELADYLNQRKDLTVEVQGHTDGRGNRAYNLDLSQRRADSVKTYLIQKGVAADRLTAKGFGPDQPIASNATAAGRAENRRVEFKPIQ